MLVINNVAKSDIAKLIEFAESNELSFDDLLDIYNNPDKSPGYNPEFNCLLNVGYRVVFTIEQQPKFKAKHISISLNEDMPPIDSVKLILQEFGFKNKLEDCHIYMEENAINVLEKID